MSTAARKEEEGRDRRLLALALASLERVGCQFWACDGPTLDPIDMKTCHVCAVLAEGRQELGFDPAGEYEEFVTRLEAIADAT